MHVCQAWFLALISLYVFSLISNRRQKNIFSAVTTQTEVHPLIMNDHQTVWSLIILDSFNKQPTNENVFKVNKEKGFQLNRTSGCLIQK